MDAIILLTIALMCRQLLCYIRSLGELVDRPRNKTTDRLESKVPSLLHFQTTIYNDIDFEKGGWRSVEKSSLLQVLLQCSFFLRESRELTPILGKGAEDMFYNKKRERNTILDISLCIYKRRCNGDSHS